MLNNSNTERMADKIVKAFEALRGHYLNKESKEQSPSGAVEPGDNLGPLGR